MQISNIPNKWYVPFAANDGAKVEIPVTTADPTRASQSLGFPPLTMQPPESGGVPPQGEDFNGAMNQVARIAWWLMAGGPFKYDASFATNANITGYPQGARLPSSDFLGAWISTADNNTVDPDATGTGWVPGFSYGNLALTGQTGGTTTLTPLQAIKTGVTVTGTLTSNLTVVVPNWLYAWRYTNSTTGAFSVTVKTAAGAGIVIPQNGAPTRVASDGTNITQAPENVAVGSGSQAMQYQQATGRWISRVVYASAGTFSETPPAGANLAVYDVNGGGGGGGSSAATAAAQIAAGAGGAGGGRAILRATSPVAQTITVGVGGTGGTSGSIGGAGGNSSVGILAVANGGAGGFGGTAGTTGASNGPLGGTATGGQINIPGAPGGSVFGSQPLVLSGNGANSVYGAGGRGQTTFATGGSAVGNSAGGGGGACPPSTGSAASGGAGGPGIVIIDYYT